MGLGHLGGDSHNQGTMPSRRGIISASRPEVSLEGPGAGWAVWAPLHLCWEEAPQPCCPGNAPKLTRRPTGLQASGGRARAPPASWPVTGAAARAGTPRPLPAKATDRLGAGHWRGTEVQGGDWAEWEARAVSCPVVQCPSWTPGSSPPACQGLTDRATGDTLPFSGDWDLELPPGMLAGAPEPTLLRRPGSLPELTKEQPHWDRPAGAFSGHGAPDRWQGQKGASVCRVWAHSGLSQPRAFPSASVSVSQPPRRPGARGSRDRESHHCPNPKDLISSGPS